MTYPDPKLFYVGGIWVEPHGSTTAPVTNPATEQVVANVALGDRSDVDRAVLAAATAFETFSRTTREERIELLEAVLRSYDEHAGDFADAVTTEMGAPRRLARNAQVPAGAGHIASCLAALRELELEEPHGDSTLRYEPIGVCGLITPWNWPLNQIGAKVGGALAAGCTMVLKPSEIAPLTGLVFAQVMHDAGVPEGVFNLVNGTGPDVGASISSHPLVDMVSFTGSTLAGGAVATAAAPTIKRVSQELGGKSAHVVLDDANLGEAVRVAVGDVMRNSGQSCNAATRLLVPRRLVEDAAKLAAEEVGPLAVGDPNDEATDLGPVVSKRQREKIRALIDGAVDEGATVVVGGSDAPDGLAQGYYVRPTVLIVDGDAEISRTEVFGPVLTITGYDGEDEAVALANATNYGLGGAVTGSPERARAVARRLRTGMVHVNGAGLDLALPFGGYKQSGNGREAGRHGILDYLEAKSIYGDRVS